VGFDLLIAANEHLNRSNQEYCRYGEKPDDKLHVSQGKIPLYNRLVSENESKRKRTNKECDAELDGITHEKIHCFVPLMKILAKDCGECKLKVNCDTCLHIAARIAQASYAQAMPQELLPHMTG
jgi:hypothetical protein